MIIDKPGGTDFLPYKSKIDGFSFPPAYAFFELNGRPEDYSFTHRLTGELLPFSSAPENLELIRAVEGINQDAFPVANKKHAIIGPGKVVINETLEYDINQSVKIKAGTQLLLKPQVSLVIRGPLKVNGTIKEPVTVRPFNPEKPFGVIALLGEETRGSRIRHFDIEGGSIYRRYNLDFTGMFSVHDNPDIEIINSRFGKNFIGDDAVHFMRSKVKIKNSIFEDAFRDAMDWDLVDGEITDSIFRNSGNDGLDLSMGAIRISNSRFEKSKDKCVSAGEGVQIMFTNSKFHKCNIGIAVKDRSKVKLTNNLFSENNIAYSSYRKKWRWKSGGEGVLRENQFFNSVQADIKGDKHSKVSFFGSIPENLRIEGKLKINRNFEK
jgi:hypothetical protein